MTIPKFRIRTLLLLTVIVGIAFVVCAKWPVTEISKAPPGAPSLSAFIPEGYIRPPRGFVKITRPPTPAEFAVRAAISTVAVASLFAACGLLRHWLARNRVFPDTGRMAGMPTKYKTSIKLWAACSVVVFCLLIAFEREWAGKYPPLRTSFVRSWQQNSDRQMPIVLVVEYLLAAILYFGIQSAAVGWVIHAIAIVAWSRLTKKKTSSTAPPPLPNGLGQF